ncbi:MAG: hypothetical protein GY915_03780 [bacterium]|nr:hypothetical protein [bacterium]
MDKIQEIDHKIKTLKLKKQEILKKISGLFFTKANQALGSNFSPELALTILEKTWSQSNLSEREVWRQASRKFLVKQPHNPSKKSAQNHSIHSSI